MLRNLLLATLALVAGCGVNPPIEGRQDPYSPSQIMFASEKLRVDTAVGTPIVTRDDSGLLHVQVPIRSAISVTLYVDYRVTFFDRNRQVVSTLGWLTKTLEANTPNQIEVTSTDARAADFQIDFRYAR